MPDNQNHRRAFIAIWVEIEYADEQFLPSSMDLAGKYGVSQRTIDIVRGKMKKLGLIRRVSHFNAAYGHRSGWTFCYRFRQCLGCLSKAIKHAETTSGQRRDEQKDRDSIHYV